uniref:Uncharacterized protein n=1 Tax=Oryza punctata TaxID=4537 RepID=A0A0E0M736_ORYPU
MALWRLTAVADERCAPKRRTTTSRWLRRRCCFGPRCRTLGNTFTNTEEVFTWAKSNNRWLLHVGNIDGTSNYENMGYIKRKVGAFMRVNVLLSKVQR